MPQSSPLFDVFGTVVDWHRSVTATLVTSAAGALSSPDSAIPSDTHVRAATLTATDWSLIARAWWDAYLRFTRGFDKGIAGWVDTDMHFHDSLLRFLCEWGLQGLYDDSQVAELARVWHALDAWPDAQPGLEALGDAGFITATLSNGSVTLHADLTNHSGLRWSHILASETFGVYKPHPVVYRGAVHRLGFHVGQCDLVAAHLGHLQAASPCGLRTVYVERDSEEAWGPREVEEARKFGGSDG
ncbi:MAG: hypothetical protein M1832_000949 [Thelocarpon impressellum]|nr:MAG: hypothetical protein M1832_000949 [Thelocarpon impressellum]